MCSLLKLGLGIILVTVTGGTSYCEDNDTIREGWYILYGTSSGTRVGDEEWFFEMHPVGKSDQDTYELLRVEKDLLGVIGARKYAVNEEGNGKGRSETLFQTGKIDTRREGSGLLIAEFELRPSDEGLDLIIAAQFIHLGEDSDEEEYDVQRLLAQHYRFLRAEQQQLVPEEHM